MKINLSFIPENIAPKGARSIGLYDSDGNKLRNIPLGNLAPKSTGNILYTFGALSDVHLPYNTGPEDFIRALNYFNNIEKVNFICISGDMGSSGVDSEWANFKAHVDAHSPNTPVHISAGNHDAGQSGNKSHDYPIPYTGNPLYYSFTQGDDVFIMFGMTFWGNPPFSNKSLQWLYETLEENRNKRCFVFQHMMRKGHAGDASGRYSWDGLNNTNGKVFLSLMEHYKNVLWFHGHSHCEFEQQDTLSLPNSNYDRVFGCHSIHVPSCCMTRNEDNGYDYEDSEGYVVDVYENGIHLRGRDFVAEKFLPIASYWIDNTLVEIPEKSYVDSRGVIDTGQSTPSEPSGEITLPENSELAINKRYSQASGGVVSKDGSYFVTIPVESDSKYILNVKNNAIAFDGGNYTLSTLYLIDSNKANAITVNGNKYIGKMTSGVTISNEGLDAEVILTTSSTTKYIVFTSSLGTTAIAEDDIKDIVITLESYRMNLPEGATYTLNARDSYSGKVTKNEAGMIRFYIPCEANTTYKLSVENLPISIYTQNAAGNTASLFCWDANKTNVSMIQNGGSSSVRDLISDGLITVTNNYKSFSMNLTTSANAGYIALSLVISTTEDITEEDIKDIVITLEE